MPSGIPDMTTLFISDLHLDDARPESTQLFEKFVHEEAMGAEALYILGDLFEYWIGDDVETGTSLCVANALSSLKDKAIPCYFMHGNRDFLLGNAYAAKCGMTLLNESALIDLYGTKTLLLHGDTLCTDDVEYQEVRKKVRSEEWQKWILSQTVDARIKFALDARDESRKHQSTISLEIMDVNQDAVQHAFESHGVVDMIHGHTHRPKVHTYSLAAGDASRTVLGDWYTQGSVLIANANGLTLKQYPAI